MLHQGILRLFRDDPWLGFDLLALERPVFGTPIDRHAVLERDEVEDPQKIKPRYPDLALVYRAEDDSEEGIVIAVEAQKQLAMIKRWRIPFYQAGLADEFELQTWIFVISFSREMSAALEAWRTGPPPRVDAHTLDADTVAPVRSLEHARQRPAAAVLAAALHGSRGDLEGARVAVKAMRELPDDQRQSYTATVLAALPERERETLMGELPVEERDTLWEIERRSGTYLIGHRNGLEEGREEGREEGLERGRQEARATLAEMIIALLEVRGLAVDPASAARIRGCESLESLQRWAGRSREVKRLAELFEP